MQNAWNPQVVHIFREWNDLFDSLTFVEIMPARF